MLESLKANILFHQLLKRPNIEKAYKMVGPEDSWYDTITTVHKSLVEIQKLPHENWQITSHDGLELQGVFYPGDSNTTVIWVHGYTSHAERESAFPALFYHGLGFNVLILYLRAHGPSGGKYISFGALEQEDIQAWVRKVNLMHSHGNIILHGLSMGGGIVLFASGKKMDDVKCIIADAPTTNIKEAFYNISRGVFKKDGDQVAQKLLARFQKEFGVAAEDYNAMKIVKNSQYPIFLTAGSNENMDTVLENLKEANPRDTQVVILPGCNHGNGMYKQTEMYQSALKAFIEKYI